jgi:hypothetical protein
MSEGITRRGLLGRLLAVFLGWRAAPPATAAPAPPPAVPPAPVPPAAAGAMPAPITVV